MELSTLLQTLIDGRNLSSDEMHWLMSQIMGGHATTAQIAGILVALRIKGETVDELAAAASVIRELASPMQISAQHLVDTCGTGGDGQSTFNISTASAFVVAAAGGTVAKHGNRSVSGTCGSADVLEAAGVNLELTAEQVQHCVETLGVGFLFAPRWHNAMKHTIVARKELGVRTLFNLLGPLSNPAQTPAQLIGVYDAQWLEPFAAVLQKLGSQHVLVVHADDGLDEISIGSSTQVAELKNGVISRYSIEPEQFGIQRSSLKPLAIETAQQSLTLIEAVLDGKPGPARDIVILNAGAAIYAADLTASLEAGVQRAAQILDNGSARQRMNDLIALSKQLADGAPVTSSAVSPAKVSPIKQSQSDTPDILKKILQRKQEEIDKRQDMRSIDDLKGIIEEVTAPRGFYQALKARCKQNKPAVIAEIKKASPSKGIICEDFNAGLAAHQYSRGGATCLSVLTDKDFFQGSEAYLQMAKQSCGLPALRKDFIIDPYQVYESRAIDADCILLIVSALQDQQMHELAELATELGMDVLVEVHDEAELQRALTLDTPLIGINNRNLHTFDTSLQTTERLARLVTGERLIVTESGIHTPADVAYMRGLGINTFLVGEALMAAADPGEKLQSLFGL